MDELPPECVRDILLRLPDHKDLERCGDAWALMGQLVQDQQIWRRLTKHHFTKQQIEFAIDKEELILTDWKKIYHKMRRYGHRRNSVLKFDYLVKNMNLLNSIDRFGFRCI